MNSWSNNQQNEHGMTTSYSLHERNFTAALVLQQVS